MIPEPDVLTFASVNKSMQVLLDTIMRAGTLSGHVSALRPEDCSATGSDDNLFERSICAAQSPDGKLECSLEWNHSQNHQAQVPVVCWVQLTAEEAAEVEDMVAGDWITIEVIDTTGNDTSVVTEYWPQRPDDFTNGEPTDRATAWTRVHGDS